MSVRGKWRVVETPDFDMAGPGSYILFAEDGGEEPEVAAIYVIGRNRMPYRVGFALMNEFSDHVVERQNYLWLAHSKLRPSSFGPELLVGDLPADVRGVSRIRRGKKVIFEQPFLTGEANMSHTIANLEAHHFKYPYFRRPGDVHVHCFGTATLSFAAASGRLARTWGERSAIERRSASSSAIATRWRLRARMSPGS